MFKAQFEATLNLGIADQAILPAINFANPETHLGDELSDGTKVNFPPPKIFLVTDRNFL